MYLTLYFSATCTHAGTPRGLTSCKVYAIVRFLPWAGAIRCVPARRIIYFELLSPARDHRDAQGAGPFQGDIYQEPWAVRHRIVKIRRLERARLEEFCGWPDSRPPSVPTRIDTLMPQRRGCRRRNPRSAPVGDGQLPAAAIRPHHLAGWAVRRLDRLAHRWRRPRSAIAPCCALRLPDGIPTAAGSFGRAPTRLRAP
jgi:hypothetical protein